MMDEKALEAHGWITLTVKGSVSGNHEHPVRFRRAEITAIQGDGKTTDTIVHLRSGAFWHVKETPERILESLAR